MSKHAFSLGTLGLLLLLAAGGALFYIGSDAAAASRVADFPTFIPWSATMEGVAVDKVGNVYVSIREGDSGLVWRFAPDGSGTCFAYVGEAMIGGLAVDANGDLYVAMGPGADRGVYCIDRKGRTTLLPGSDEIVFANALALDKRGNLYVTESHSSSEGPGGIWRVPPGGEAELWLRDDLLTGIGEVLGYPVGANGIAFYQGDLYVVNTDKGLVVRVPVMPNGNPGQPHIWATLEEVYSPAIIEAPVLGDGIALDVHGNVYIALVSRMAVVKIDAAEKTQQAIAAAYPFTPNGAPLAPLDTPASLAFGTGKGGRSVLFVTNLGMFGQPGLVMIEVGTPGRPLP